MQTSPHDRVIDAPALSVERAIVDLRFGRAVLVETADGAALVAAAETCDGETLRAMIGLGDGAQPRVIVTSERADALGLRQEGDGNIALTPRDGLELETLRGLAGGPPAGAAGAQLDRTTAAEDAAIALMKLARLLPAAVSVAATGDVAPLLASGRLLAVGDEAIADYRHDTARGLRRVSDARIPLHNAGEARFIVFRAAASALEHVAVIVGDIEPSQAVAVRLHSACLTGDIFGSLRCDCGDQLAESMAALSETGGILLYLAQEGRGIGLANKLRAYRLQEEGADTLEANTTLGFRSDERHYEDAAEMLKQLGIARVVLITNNPGKIAGLEAAGLAIEGRRGLTAAINPHNERYMTVRAERAGHWLD